MSNFKTKQVKTQTLGEVLLSARSHLGISVAEISKLSKLPLKYLAALEEGDYARLPANVYVKGFLKTLAAIYRTNEQVLLALFEAEKGVEENISTQSREARVVVPNFVYSPRTVAVAVVATVGILSMSYLYFQISSVRKPPALQIFSPEQNGFADTSLMVVRGKTEPGASVFLNNQPVVVDVSGEFRENLSLAPGTNTLVIKAVSKFEKETVVTRQVAVPEKQIAGAFDQAASTATSTPGVVSGVELTIQVGPAASWVSIEADGAEEFTGTMLAGSSRLVFARDQVRVSTGNAGSTRVILNGQDFGIMGKEGEILRDVEFNR